MSYAQREQRVRVLQALERTIRQFRTRKELWPLRVPSEPVSLNQVIRQALESSTGHFDPLTIRSRSLLQFRWDDNVVWELWVIALPSGMKLYCDTSEDESRILATGRRDSEIETDRLFLELLAESGGQHFGIEMAGGPPTRVRSSIDDRQQIVNFFVHLFEVAGLEEEIRGETDERHPDFQTDVEHWLERTMK